MSRHSYIKRAKRYATAVAACDRETVKLARMPYIEESVLRDALNTPDEPAGDKAYAVSVAAAYCVREDQRRKVAALRREVEHLRMALGRKKRAEYLAEDIDIRYYLTESFVQAFPPPKSYVVAAMRRRVDAIKNTVRGIFDHVSSGSFAVRVDPAQPMTDITVVALCQETPEQRSVLGFMKQWAAAVKETAPSRPERPDDLILVENDDAGQLVERQYVEGEIIPIFPVAVFRPGEKKQWVAGDRMIEFKNEIRFRDTETNTETPE